jgi:hypothetical protein
VQCSAVGVYVTRFNAFIVGNNIHFNATLSAQNSTLKNHPFRYIIHINSEVFYEIANNAAPHPQIGKQK